MMTSFGLGVMPLSSALSSAHQAVMHARLTSLSQEHRYKRKCKQTIRMIKDLIWENSILFEELQNGITETNFRIDERRRLTRTFVHKVNKHIISQRRTPPSCIELTPTGNHRLVFPSGLTRNLIGLPERPKSSIASSQILQPKTRKKGSSEKKYVQLISLDSMGRPVFPIVLPGIEVHCLGELDNKRPAYHTEYLLFPIGFCSSREYAASSDPSIKTIYTCTVNDNGNEPKFELSGEDTPTVFSGKSPDDCVSALIAAINEKLPANRKVPQLPHGKGTEFFGLSIPTIHHLIQGCLGTRKCLRYKPVRYETSRNPPPAHLNQSLDIHLSYAAFQAKVLKS